MKCKNMTRKALFTSIISLLLCVSMLVGTTFAWFTDEVKTGMNTIAAGNLDVELEANGVEVKPDTMLFSEVEKWEPGVVVYENLQVVNKGTLALKYQMSLNFGNENEFNGHKLSEVLKVAVIDKVADNATRAEVLAAAEKSAKKGALADFSMTGELEAGKESDVQAVVVYWTPNDNTIDNLYNVNNNQTTSDGKPLHIEFGVLLQATQKMSEEDSFGDDYDKDAWVDGFKVYSAQDLQAAINNGETTVVLENDVTASEPIVVPAGAEYAMNLNGNTLVANVSVEKDAEVKIVNGTLKSANPENSAIETVGNLTLEDVTVTSDRHGVRVEGGETVINGGYYEASGYQGRTQHALNVSDGGKVIVNGGTFVGPAGTSSDSGSAVNVQTGSTVTINGGNFSGGKNNTLSAAGTLIVKGGTFDQDPSAYVAAGYSIVTNAQGTYTVLKGEAAAGNDQALKDALNAGKKDIALGAGEFNMPTTTGEVTITGTHDTNITINKPTADKVSLNGVTVVGSGYATGIQHSNTVVYENCVIKGVQCLYADEVVIKNCVIDLTEVTDYIWTYGAKNVTFDGCTFNTNGKAILIYNEGADLVTNVTVKNCTFNATAGALASGYPAAAIELDSSLSTNGHYTLTTENNTVDSDFAGEWRIKKSGADNTTVNGTVHNAITLDGKLVAYDQATLQAAIDAAKDGAVINLMPGKYSGTINAKSNITIVGTEGAVVECIHLNGAENVTLKNIVFDAAKAQIAYDGKGNGKQYANILSGDASKPAKGSRNLVIDGCTFSGAFANGGTAIAFTDQNRGSGQSGDITIKNCTFATTGAYYDIYMHYSGSGYLNIEGNTFDSECQGLPIYLGRYQSSTPVVVKGNAFKNVDSFENAAYIQAHSSAYTVSFDAADNTFGG